MKEQIGTRQNKRQQERQMKKEKKILGITGAVGAGKSTVLSYLEGKYHARVIQADQEAHELMRQGGDCYKAIVETFGTEILKADGEIDRAKLSDLVFCSSDRIETLNRIVHPAVKRQIRSLIEREKAKEEIPFFVIEAALLIEDHYEEVCDEIWYLYVDEETRTKRLIASRGYTREKVEEIRRKQLSDEEFRAHCQFVVDNTGEIVENTYEQIDKGLIKHEFL